MSVIDRLLGRAGPRASLALPPLVSLAARQAAWWEHRQVEPALLRARLADRFRDAKTEPVAPQTFDALTGSLDTDGWRRLAVLASLLEEPGGLQVLAVLGPARGAEAHVTDAWVSVARDKSLLTMKLLRSSALRAEELCRAWARKLGAAIDGESPEASRLALERLDYARLLAEAETARKLAEARLEYLQKAQTEEDKRRSPRRGKW
ncbi:MAG: hypothetical protein HY909_11155 [Deltaproteobacteria bacterium]|nr:hypothetical protein [Deltaproteobacteria bacterium]